MMNNNSLEEPCDSAIKELECTGIVPNKFPTVKGTPYRIAIIGEAPGEQEVKEGQPFVGQSGRLLTQILQKKGITREALFIGNVCQHRPPGNDIDAFALDSPEIQSGLEKLSLDLEQFNPNICLLLGKTALWAAKGIDKIGNWRGSFFMGERNCFIGRKCIAAYHPAAILRQYQWMPLLMLDIDKCLKESTFPELTLPDRQLDLHLSKHEIIHRLQNIRQNKTKIALDIEGGINTWSCMSIATSPFECFIIPFTNSGGTSYWFPEDECDVLTALSEALADPTVPKILQNSLYDRFVLQYSYNILIFGVVEDTMLKSWEKQNELEKGLDFLCSVYTKEPYYKSERKTQSMETYWRYCCKDSVITYEISEVLDPLLSPRQLEHYHFNIDLLNLLLYCELKGINYDVPESKNRLEKINSFYYRIQHRLNELAGLDCFAGKSKDLLESAVRKICCFKRNPEIPKKDFEKDLPRIITILKQDRDLTDEEKGYIASVCGWDMNVKSKKFKTYLYQTLKLPAQFKLNKETGTNSYCTDNDALLKLKKNLETRNDKYPNFDRPTAIKIVDTSIQIMELRTRSQMLSIYADSDHRIRCGYNLVGTVTGRLSSYTSPTGSGYNLQTIPDDYKSLPEGHPLRQGMRDLFLADDDYWMFQCDLKGADGWTIGAHLHNLGDSTMLEDLKAGIKPAARICYILRHGMSGLISKPRDEIKEMLKEIKGDDWDYFACKIGIWGQCYTLGPDLQSSQICEESYGQVNMTRKEIMDFRDCVFRTYNIRLWHRYVQHLIDKPGFPRLTCASGSTRIFYGRKTEILGEYLSTEPQNNTTYATNLAARNLWRDPDNRTEKFEMASESGPANKGTLLKIQPLHQVHDALIGQFKKSDTAWAIGKIKQAFSNIIIIAGMPITIPFDGKYGVSWGNLNEGTI